ncbi:hypothetical protein HAL_03020 [Haladaptatus sp. T7]|nr:hypothetical protein HAL_03020 [Haladaptatus sp. T7]
MENVRIIERFSFDRRLSNSGESWYWVTLITDRLLPGIGEKVDNDRQPNRMTTSTHEADDPRRDRDDDRYAELEVQDDAVLIYDQKNHTAWICSNGAVSLYSML